MWAALLTVVALVAADPWPDVAKVLVEGEAAGIGWPARIAAEKNAQLSAVADLLEQVVASRDLSPFRRVLDSSLSYVASYSVLRCLEDAGVTRVEMEVQVATRQLRRDAAMLLLQRVYQKPRVLVLIAEPETASSRSVLIKNGVTERALTDALKKAGIEVIDSAVLRTIYQEEELVGRFHHDPNVGKAVACAAMADVAVLGDATCRAEPTVRGTNMLRNTARLVLRFFRGQDGSLADELVSEAIVNSADTYEGPRLAMRDAAVKTGRDAVASIVLAALSAKPGNGVALSIEGLGRPVRLDEIIRTLGQRTDVANIEELCRSKTLGSLWFEYTGSLAQLEEYLTTRRYSDFRLQSRHILDRRMTLVVHPGVVE